MILLNRIKASTEVYSERNNN